jgi:glycosyltransferase involved in cell wall biosynthesis
LNENHLVENLQPLYRTRETFLGGVNNKYKEFLFNSLNYIPFVHTSKKENRKFCINLLKQGNFDVFHPTFFDPYFLPYLQNRPFVLTIHDLICLRIMPHVDNLQCKENLYYLANKAAHIVAVSQHTKQDIIELLNIPSECISVIYHGAPDVDIAMVRQQPRLINTPYLLYVGARNVAYKNFIPFIKQTAGFLHTHPKIHVVCTGLPFTQDEYHLFVSLGIEKQMIHVFASSQELYNLYNNAEVFIFPSSYEGFGIPILEAFACECPVLLNHASCLPEIASNAALYFHMPQEIDYQFVLNQFWEHRTENRQDLIRKGREQLQRYSWATSALQLSTIYKRIIS